MPNNGFKIEGLDTLNKTLKTISHAVRIEVLEELKASALEINSLAAQNIQSNGSIGASGGGGGLLGSQQMIESDPSTFEIVNTAPYAAYVEFGTGARVSVPAEWKDYAALFKRGSNRAGGIEMVKRLTEWVRAKGLSGRYSVKTRQRVGGKNTQANEDKKVAYAIYLSIVKNGIYAHPFLYPAYIKVKQKIMPRVKEVINTAMKS